MEDIKLIQELGKTQMINRCLGYLARLPYEDVDIEAIMKSQGYHTIAIYGMGMLGQIFFKQIACTNIKVCYGIDRNLNIKDCGVEIRTIEKIAEDMDAIIITSEFYYDEIVGQLRGKVNCPVILLKELLCEILWMTKAIES